MKKIAHVLNKQNLPEIYQKQSTLVSFHYSHDPPVSTSMQLQFWRQRTGLLMTSHFVGESSGGLCDVTFCPPMESLTWCLPALAEWKIATAVKINCNSSDVSESRACQPGWEPTSLSQCLRSTPRTAMQSSSALAAAPCRAGASARR